jgi:hypothetical protein
MSTFGFNFLGFNQILFFDYIFLFSQSQYLLSRDFGNVQAHIGHLGV